MTVCYIVWMAEARYGQDGRREGTVRGSLARWGGRTVPATSKSLDVELARFPRMAYVDIQGCDYFHPAP